jgi:quinoprotein glucose dehydrogenase
MESEVSPPADMDVSKIIRFPQLGTPYAVENSFLTSPLGAPCTEPPWGRLTAVDLVITIKCGGTGSEAVAHSIPLDKICKRGSAIVTPAGHLHAATVDDYGPLI